MDLFDNDDVVIRIEKLYKSFHDGEKTLDILCGLDFKVAAGQSIAIIGRSGTGKSTLLNTIGLLDTPTSGSIFLNNIDIGRLGDAAKTRIRGQEIGFVFQQYHLFSDLNALDNVLIAGNFARKNRGKKFALELLEQVGLQDRLRHKPAKLSGGEQQRVAIARALFTEPAILLCDEPTGNLDPQSGSEVMGLLFEVVKKQGAAMVIVTHDKQLADLADHAYRLLDGVLVSAEFDPPV